MIDVFTMPVPASHTWAIIAVWVAGYIGGRMMAGLR